MSFAPGDPLYIDSSALIKRYIGEQGSDSVQFWINNAGSLITSMITFAEVAAAIARVRRMNLISVSAAAAAFNSLEGDWPSLQKLPLLEGTVIKAGNLVKSFDLRGYDAVQLASALIAQDLVGRPIWLATFDQLLASAAIKAGIKTLP